MSILAVIFDMDGLMLDTERLARTIHRQVALSHGWTISDEIYSSLVGRNHADSQLILRDALGEDFPLEKIDHIYIEAYYEHLLREGAPVKPGLFELLSFLEERGLRRAVATSTYRERTELKLRGAGLAGRFQAAVSGDEVSRGKPEPDIFIEAARRLGVNPLNCLVLEDSGPGIKAAVSAGMKAILVPDLAPPGDEIRTLAEGTCQSLFEAKVLMEKML